MNLHQPLLGLGLRGRRANDANHFVDVGVGQEQAFDGVLALPCPEEQKLRAPPDYRFAMPQEFFQQFLDVQHPRLAVDQGQEDDGKTVLQRA